MSTGNDQHSNLVQITPRRPAPLGDDYWQRVEDLAKAPTGTKYWRSLEELADTKDFQQFVQNEFPSQLEEFSDPVGRRRFLKLMGASLALAGASACAWQPREQLVPYIEQPEEIVPGKSLFFATAMTIAGVATGLLARSREGRPVKIEGNPQHPASLGATDIYAQASILTLYDPDRSRTILERGEIRSWANFRGALREALDEQRIRRGAGLRILTETVVSPTLADQLRGILAELPEAKWHQYEPVGRDGAGAGARLAFGQPVNTIYRFDQAARVLSIDSDFLGCAPGDLRYAREFIARRRVEDVKQDMNRLYAVESTPANTGALADHRLSLRPSEIEPFTRTVAAALGASAGATSAVPAYTAHAEWIAAMVRDLQQFRGRSIIIAGSEQSPTVHALAHAMNAALGNVGTTVIYTDPVEANPVDQMQSIRELTDDMEAGRVELLMIIGGNPVYNAPADLNFRERLDKVKLRAHLSLYNDETSELCHWHIPEAHYLEAWSDTRAYDGTATIVQPLVEPLYEGRSAHELLAIFLSQPAGAGTGYDTVRNFWQSQNRGGDFEGFWRRALHDGMVPNTALQPKTVALQGTQESVPGVITGSEPQTSGLGLDIV
nr:TAT-variant-translocated molybdopterin oxidoreductase [Pyrinomonadaceae bacterium]